MDTAALMQSYLDIIDMAKDLRFSLPLGSLFPWIFLYARPKARYMMRHPEKYNDQDKFDFGMRVIDKIKHRARVKTLVYGRDNVPRDETVVYYSNHQGKFDALGILRAMNYEPTSVLWDKKTSNRIIATEMSFLVCAVQIDLETMKGKAQGIIEAIDLVKSGRDMLIFPEGYTDPTKCNRLGEFQSGCFACSLKTHTTIVPIAIYDSYKAMNGNNIFKTVTVQVHFLDPIRYEEYKDLNKQELSDLVKSRIEAKIEELDNTVEKGALQPDRNI